MKTLDFIESTERLISDILDAHAKVVAFLKGWTDEYPPDISKPWLEEENICFELEWYQGDHNSVLLYIRNNADPLLFTSRNGKYKHTKNPTNEQILEEVKWAPIQQGHLTKFWR